MTRECMTPTFKLQFCRPGDRAWVVIGAAAVEASVQLNGRYIGTHLGPWTPCEIEITDYLQDHNELTILCTDKPYLCGSFLSELDVHWTGVRDVEIRIEPTPAPAASQAKPEDCPW